VLPAFKACGRFAVAKNEIGGGEICLFAGKLIKNAGKNAKIRAEMLIIYTRCIFFVLFFTL